MKIALLSVFAFACTSFAAPLPVVVPSQIQQLQVTILDVVRDLNRGDVGLKEHYLNGMEQFAKLIDELPGAEKCTHLSSFQPKSEDNAIMALLHSREHLLQSVTNVPVRDDLKKRDLVQLVFDPTRPSICSAFARYYAVKPYISSLFWCDLSDMNDYDTITRMTFDLWTIYWIGLWNMEMANRQLDALTWIRALMKSMIPWMYV